MRITDTHVYFHGGLFSNWAQTPFEMTLPGSARVRTLRCGEQAFMALKALHFGDYKVAAQILEATTPGEQKSLGRTVTPFDEAEWHAAAPRAMFAVGIAKYCGHAQAHAALIDSGRRILVEASPRDRLWGVGLDAHDPRILDAQTWLGSNWLGTSLDQVRTFLTYRAHRQANGTLRSSGLAETMAMAEGFFDRSKYAARAG